MKGRFCEVGVLQVGTVEVDATEQRELRRRRCDPDQVAVGDRAAVGERRRNTDDPSAARHLFIEALREGGAGQLPGDRGTVEVGVGKSVPARLAPVRLASDRLVLLSDSPLRSTPGRSAPEFRVPGASR